jgi:hypothetical protein
MWLHQDRKIHLPIPSSAGRILRAATIHRTLFTREGALSGGLASKL